MKDHEKVLPEREKLVKILGIKSTISEEELSDYYYKIKNEQREKMLKAKDIRDRVRLQNLVLAIDDAFLDYQDSVNRELRSKL